MADPVPNLDKTPRAVAGMFDAIAGRYDLLNHLLSAGLDVRWRATAIRAADLRPGARLLDLCAGTADVALAAAVSEPALAGVVGVDFSAGMLERARVKACRRSGPPPLHLVRGDATSVPIRSDSVDAVTLAFGLRNVVDPEAALAEIRRVLRAGGRLVVLEFAAPRGALGRIYRWYFRRVLPAIGRLISRHPSAYSYLPASVSIFAAPDALAGLVRACGLILAEATPLSGGVVWMYVARKGSVEGLAGRPGERERDAIMSINR